MLVPNEIIARIMTWVIETHKELIDFTIALHCPQIAQEEIHIPVRLYNGNKCFITNPHTGVTKYLSNQFITPKHKNVIAFSEAENFEYFLPSISVLIIRDNDYAVDLRHSNVRSMTVGHYKGKVRFTKECIEGLKMSTLHTSCGDLTNAPRSICKLNVNDNKLLLPDHLTRLEYLKYIGEGKNKFVSTFYIPHTCTSLRTIKLDNECHLIVPDTVLTNITTIFAMETEMDICDNPNCITCTFPSAATNVTKHFSQSWGSSCDIEDHKNIVSLHTRSAIMKGDFMSLTELVSRTLVLSQCCTMNNLRTLSTHELNYLPKLPNLVHLSIDTLLDASSLMNLTATKCLNYVMIMYAEGDAHLPDEIIHNDLGPIKKTEVDKSSPFLGLYVSLSGSIGYYVNVDHNKNRAS
jgi:hypothetical protein